MTTPVATVDATGLHVPDFNTILTYLQTSYQSIYGNDVVLTPDTQDGQWIGILATAINDANAACAAVYNAFSPSTAQGTGLASNVKINGLVRKVASYSQADLLIVGQAGAIITDGIAADVNGYQWALPATVTIPPEGQVTASSTCTTIGAVPASAGDISNIFTPTLGWQSVTNPAPASLGNPVETDARLRIRQSQSTTMPAQSGLDSLVGAVLGLPGVSACKPYENDSELLDINGFPPKSFALVVAGGDATAIAQTILTKKTEGARALGDTILTVLDRNGIPRQIGFYRPSAVPISIAITLRGTTGYTADVSAAIQSAIAAWVNGLGDGNDVPFSRAYTPANSVGTSYKIKSLTIGVRGGLLGASDISIQFNATATCDPADVVITVTP